MINTTELFPIKTTYPPPDKKLDYWIIVAWWAPGGWWKVFSPQYLTEEKAQFETDLLPRGYTERHIFHLKVTK